MTHLTGLPAELLLFLLLGLMVVVLGAWAIWDGLQPFFIRRRHRKRNDTLRPVSPAISGYDERGRRVSMTRSQTAGLVFMGLMVLIGLALLVLLSLK